MEDALLRIKEVSKHFGGVYAVNGVSLEVHPGGICGLVGPNGSGKSTLFGTILGLHKPDDGEIYFQNELISHLSPHTIYEKGLVYAFQIPRLFYSLSVMDNMLVAARGQEGDRLFNSLFLRNKWQQQEKELIEEALDILEIIELEPWAFTPAAELSGGQRKLLELGRALMAKPKLLFLDEPAAGINPVLAKKIFQKLKALTASGMALFVVEHRLEILFEFVSWVYIMDKGKIALSGKPQEIIDNPDFYAIYLGEE